MQLTFYSLATKNLVAKVATGFLYDWVVPEKIHTPPTDGILEILAGGGGRRLRKSRREGGLTLKKSSAGVISTDS